MPSTRFNSRVELTDPAHECALYRFQGFPPKAPPAKFRASEQGAMAPDMFLHWNYYLGAGSSFRIEVANDGPSDRTPLSVFIIRGEGRFESWQQGSDSYDYRGYAWPQGQNVVTSFNADVDDTYYVVLETDHRASGTTNYRLVIDVEMVRYDLKKAVESCGPNLPPGVNTCSVGLAFSSNDVVVLTGPVSQDIDHEVQVTWKAYARASFYTGLAAAVLAGMLLLYSCAWGYYFRRDRRAAGGAGYTTEALPLVDGYPPPEPAPTFGTAPPGQPYQQPYGVAEAPPPMYQAAPPPMYTEKA